MPLAWSPDGKGFVGWTESLGQLHFAVFDFAGNRPVVLPLPPDHHLPRHMDYGYYWVDWSRD